MTSIFFGFKGQVYSNAKEINLEQATPLSHFQVFGERRTGTNYVNKLFQQNTNLSSCLHYGWKHGYFSTPAVASDALLIVVVRDPIDWLVSFYSTPFAAMPPLNKLSFSRFIRSEWESEARPKLQQWNRFGHREDMALHGEINQLDRHPIEGRRYENVLEMRRVKLNAHFGILRRANCAVLIRYEDCKTSASTIVDLVRNTFNIEGPEGFEAIVQKIGPEGNERKLSRNDISAEDLAFISENLDNEMEKLLGYRIAL